MIIKEKTKKYYYLDKEDRKKFLIWLVENDSNISEFARKVGTSDTSIHRYLHGQVSITPKIEKLFLKGGYHIFPVKQENLK